MQGHHHLQTREDDELRMMSEEMRGRLSIEEFRLLLKFRVEGRLNSEEKTNTFVEKDGALQFLVCGSNYLVGIHGQVNEFIESCALVV